MRAIIDSIHSQVPRSIESLGPTVDLVVSLDSHLDVAFGGDDHIYPRELRVIARRTGAHTAIRRLLDRNGGNGVLVVAIPERMYARHAQEVETSLPSALRISSREESLSSVAEFLLIDRGIEVFRSPPASLLELVARTKTSNSWVLDVDIDYMFELQDECYTRIVRPGPGVLQSASHVLEFVRRALPPTITLSEARIRAIRDPKSSFSKFVSNLRTLGYDVDQGEVMASDTQVMRGISECKRFYNSVSKKLLAEHMEEMIRGDFSGFRSAEMAAAREFFSKRGRGGSSTRKADRRPKQPMAQGI